jgi:hypothetical protein
MNDEEKDLEVIEEELEERKVYLDVFRPEKLKVDAPKPPQMIMFDRYFMSLGRPMHHKAGMLAFCNTKGKKTREAWQALFAQY